MKHTLLLWTKCRKMGRMSTEYGVLITMRDVLIFTKKNRVCTFYTFATDKFAKAIPWLLLPPKPPRNLPTTLHPTNIVNSETADRCAHIYSRHVDNFRCKCRLSSRLLSTGSRTGYSRFRSSSEHAARSARE
jgi:hypothetical protein